MNLWDIFFTTQATEPPKFDLFWYVSIFTLLALTFYTAYRYREKKVYQRFFQILQAVQLILLYGWYGINHMPLSESLPFYHCRMAMFVVLLLPGQSKYRQYFALLGTFGTLAAFVYPVPDAYPFPHIAILSFIFGHLALLGKLISLSIETVRCENARCKKNFSHDLCPKCLNFCGQFSNRWRLWILDKTTIGWGSWLSS